MTEKCEQVQERKCMKQHVVDEYILYLNVKRENNHKTEKDGK